MDHPPAFPPHPSGADTDLQQMRSALAAWELFGRALDHELGAPLLVIEAYANLLEAEANGISPRSRKYLERLRSVATHLRSLGMAVLRMAPVPAQPIRWERVDLSALAWQAIDVLRAEDPSRKVDIGVEPGMSAKGDPDLLRSLLANLLANAWKFTAARPVAEIDIRTVDTQYGLALRVCDNGTGFDMQHAGRLFTPFGRLPGPLDSMGAGLGLATALRIVERHSGMLWADAREGEGARFYFVLGAAPAPAVHAPDVDARG